MRNPQRHFGTAICIAYVATHPRLTFWPFCNVERMHQFILESNFTRGLARDLVESKMTKEVIVDGLEWALYLFVRAGEWAYMLVDDYLEYSDCMEEEEWYVEDIRGYVEAAQLDWPKLNAICNREPALYGAIMDETVRQLKLQFPSKFAE